MRQYDLSKDPIRGIGINVLEFVMATHLEILSDISRQIEIYQYRASISIRWFKPKMFKDESNYVEERGNLPSSR